MTKEKQIIIPNIECMKTEQYDILIDLLDSVPVEYRFVEITEK